MYEIVGIAAQKPAVAQLLQQQIQQRAIQQQLQQFQQLQQQQHPQTQKMQNGQPQGTGAFDNVLGYTCLRLSVN